MVAQLVFLIAIYRVFFNISKAGLIVDSSGLYPFVHNPGQINHMFLGLIDMTSIINLSQLSPANIPHLILILLAAVAQYYQMKMMMAKQAKSQSAKGTDFTQTMSQQMLFLGPLLTLFIGIKFPAGLALYWLVSTGFMVAQQYYLQRETA